ncbi:MAG: sensor histidine kinase, partial [Wenzhouxiangella sp.]|nr:sensor histidine kinase [Wenzhouxiangella sp.]
LLLQPLVENAIVHGISRRAEGGTLRIQGERIRFGRIRFTVTNPLADPDSRPAEGNRSALDNIRQRLALAYEERYGLKTRIEDGQFIAELTIPIES